MPGGSIGRIVLRDIGPHERLEVCLEPGVTAILGRVGAGKTSLIRAIGAALFESRVSSSLVREGQESGEITLELEGPAGVTRIGRRVGKGPSWTLVGATGRILSGVRDVRARLSELLVLPEGIDSDTLWEQAIAVPQATHTGALLQQAAQRRAYYGHLLGVGRSTRAWEALAAPTRDLEARRLELELELARLSGILESLPGIRGSLTVLEGELPWLRRQVELAGHRTAEASGLLARYQVAVSRARESDQAEVRASELLARAEQDRDLAREAERSAREAAAQLQTLAQSEISWQEASRYLQSGQQQLRRARQIEQETARLEAQRGIRRDELARLEEDIATLRLQQTELGELAGVDREILSLQDRLADLQIPGEVRLLPLQEETIRLQEGVARLDAAGQAREARRAELVSLLTELPDEVETLTQVRASLADLRSLRSLATQALQDLDHRGSSCPTCDQALSEDARAVRRGRLSSRIQILDGDRDRLEKELGGILWRSARRDRASQEISTLGTQEQSAIAHRIEQAGALARAEEALRQAALLAAERTRSLDRRQGYRDRLAILEPQRERIAALRSDIQSRGHLTSRHLAAETELARLEEGYRRLATEIVELAPELRRLEEAEQTSTRLLGDHEAYLGLAREAGRWPAASTALVQAEAALVCAQQSRDDAWAEAASDRGAVQGYGDGAEVATRAGAAAAELARLEADLRSRETELARLEEALRSLQSLETGARDLEIERSRIVGGQERLGVIRETIREAGPIVVRRRVQQVQGLAQVYYSDILGRSESLRWDTEDYGLCSSRGGIERPYASHSGGERMALALALRLGLCHALLGSSDLRLLILDEPTDGLAQEDRYRLAEQLEGLTGWYRQILVVSHDDAFDGLGAHVIRIGGS